MSSVRNFFHKSWNDRLAGLTGFIMDTFGMDAGGWFAVFCLHLTTGIVDCYCEGDMFLFMPDGNL
jgi:hypothetical protein